MKDLTTGRAFGKAGGTLAAVLTAAAILGASAGAQAQSVAAVPQNQAVPDPRIAEGLDVFSEKGELIGQLAEVIRRDGRNFGILAVREWPTEQAQLVEFPYESLNVRNGILTYDVDRTVNDPIKRDPTDTIDWEPLDQRMDIEQQ